ncbi:CheY-like chemotaxis protein [Pontibacter aydingkolensis]|uniref:Response regulator n=1 Tax=Pontibacter aydingkolensis TaxID=1911536 RepID=A0ABS7CYG3_9BACT|nr:response regulator [Pontibacter aydingkolensis]MBW7468903.1 response regulator [Pontibacter aydingkolensis]
MIDKVMLIDDDVFCNRLNTLTIEQLKFAKATMVFECAEEALDYLRQQVRHGKEETFPDLILLDLSMAHMNGWDFLNHFDEFPARYKNRTSICILTSSIAVVDREAAALRPDVISYLVKPLSSDDLKMIVSSMPPLLRKSKF